MIMIAKRDENSPVFNEMTGRTKIVPPIIAFISATTVKEGVCTI
jgi:hypothetical protein